MQLGKLRTALGPIRETGAEVLAISNDDVHHARLMAGELGGEIVVLSDPPMRVIRRYGMNGTSMPMAEMGYVVIDRYGRIRARAIDRQFGQHADAMVQALKDAA